MSARSTNASASKIAGNQEEEDKCMIMHRSEDLDSLGTP